MMNGKPQWQWLPLAIVVWSSLLTTLFVHAHYFPDTHTVYDIYGPAARNWWAGRDLYVRYTDYYRYSPLVAIMFSPFAALPDAWGAPLWKLMNGLLYAAGIWAWSRKVLPVTPSRNQRAWLFLLVIPGSLHSMYIGQANLLMIGACLLGLSAIADSHWNRAAGWLALATLIKGYPLALGLILAVMFWRKFAARFAAALGIGLILPFAAQYPGIVVSQYTSWIKHLSDSTVIMRERLRSIDYLLQIINYPVSPAGFVKMSVLAGAITLGICLFAAWRTADLRKQLTCVFMLFAVWVVLFGPATESCTYAVIAPALAWALIDSFSSSSSFRRLTLAASLVMMGPIVTDLFGKTVRNFSNEHGSQPAGAILFFLCLVTELFGVAPRRTFNEPPATLPIRKVA